MHDQRAEDDGAAQDPGGDYEPPQVVVLGTLADLTQGGSDGPPDSFGGAGDSGIL